MKIPHFILLILAVCMLTRAADLPEPMHKAFSANDYATFVEEAEKIPNGDERLAEALFIAAGRLQSWHPMDNLTENPMTDIRIMEYLLERGAGRIMIPPHPVEENDDHFDKPMPASMIVLFDMIMTFNSYPALLVAARCDIGGYVNTLIAPHGKTLLYLALDRGLTDIAQLLMYCGADKSINPAGEPPLEDMLKRWGEPSTKKAWTKIKKAVAHVGRDTEASDALQQACDRNDFPAFLKAAARLPDRDIRLGEALLYAMDGLSFAQNPMHYRANPVTRQRIIDYLLARGVGDIMMPSRRISPSAYYDKEMPAAVLAVCKAVLNRQFYLAALVSAHYDIRPYINERLMPNQTTLLYMALERDNMRTVQILLLCGADEKLHPVNAPSVDEMMKTKRAEIRDWWSILLEARKAEPRRHEIYGLTRPRYF